MKIPKDSQIWIDARKKYRLTHAQVQMATELGMNPKRFGKIANHRQEPWKMPLPQFIEHLYRKHFHKDRPDRIVSIEERVTEVARRKKERTERRRSLSDDGRSTIAGMDLTPTQPERSDPGSEDEIIPF
jgi:hypothetical protein